MSGRHQDKAKKAYHANLLLSREVEARREAQAPHRGSVIRSRCFLLSVELAQVNNNLQKGVWVNTWLLTDQIANSRQHMSLCLRVLLHKACRKWGCERVTCLPLYQQNRQPARCLS